MGRHLFEDSQCEMEESFDTPDPRRRSVTSQGLRKQHGVKQDSVEKTISESVYGTEPTNKSLFSCSSADSRKGLHSKTSRTTQDKIEDFGLRRKFDSGGVFESDPKSRGYTVTGSTQNHALNHQAVGGHLAIIKDGRKGINDSQNDSRSKVTSHSRYSVSSQKYSLDSLCTRRNKIASQDSRKHSLDSQVSGQGSVISQDTRKHSKDSQVSGKDSITSKGVREHSLDTETRRDSVTGHGRERDSETCHSSRRESITRQASQVSESETYATESSKNVSNIKSRDFGVSPNTLQPKPSVSDANGFAPIDHAAITIPTSTTKRLDAHSKDSAEMDDSSCDILDLQSKLSSSRKALSPSRVASATEVHSSTSLPTNRLPPIPSSSRTRHFPKASSSGSLKTQRSLTNGTNLQGLHSTSETNADKALLIRGTKPLCSPLGSDRKLKILPPITGTKMRLGSSDSSIDSRSSTALEPITPLSATKLLPPITETTDQPLPPMSTQKSSERLKYLQASPSQKDFVDGLTSRSGSISLTRKDSPIILDPLERKGSAARRKSSYLRESHFILEAIPSRESLALQEISNENIPISSNSEGNVLILFKLLNIFL